MWRTIYVVAVCLVFVFGAFNSSQAITIDTVPVGNPGNSADPNTGSLYGEVDYSYDIGKYDVTVGQYTAFLNAVAASDPYGVYSTSLASDRTVAGITRSGSPGSYIYSVIGSPNHPITYVSLFSAARFCNWLYNGQPTGAEGPTTTELGSYSLYGVDPVFVGRNANATWVIPSENEWYKAAYYDPIAGHYWNYATGTNTMPTSSMPGTTPNTANYFSNSTGFAVTGSKSYNQNQNYLTDIGAYTNSASPYGTFDQVGDVFEWTDTLVINDSNQILRIIRGNDWQGDATGLSSSQRLFGDAEVSFYKGFRVALVPEPPAFLLLGFGGMSSFLCLTNFKRYSRYCKQLTAFLSRGIACMKSATWQAMLCIAAVGLTASIAQAATISVKLVDLTGGNAPQVHTIGIYLKTDQSTAAEGISGTQIDVISQGAGNTAFVGGSGAIFVGSLGYSSIKPVALDASSNNEQINFMIPQPVLGLGPGYAYTGDGDLDALGLSIYSIPGNVTPGSAGGQSIGNSGDFELVAKESWNFTNTETLNAYLTGAEYFSDSTGKNFAVYTSAVSVPLVVTIVPEPGTAALLAIGGVIALAASRRHRCQLCGKEIINDANELPSGWAHLPISRLPDGSAQTALLCDLCSTKGEAAVWVLGRRQRKDQDKS